MNSNSLEKNSRKLTLTSLNITILFSLQVCLQMSLWFMAVVSPKKLTLSCLSPSGEFEAELDWETDWTCGLPTTRHQQHNVITADNDENVNNMLMVSTQADSHTISWMSKLSWLCQQQPENVDNKLIMPQLTDSTKCGLIYQQQADSVNNMLTVILISI